MLCFVEPAGTVIGAVVPFSRVVISAGNADFLRYSNQFIFLTDWAGASSDGSYSIGSGVMDFRKISASDEDLQVFRRRERGLTQKNLVNGEPI